MSNTENHNDKGMSDYIEWWFQSIMQLLDALLLQQFLEFNQPILLAPHTLVIIHVYLLSKGMSLILTLLHRWLHWKFSYT